jgi:hypothetical protein
MTDAGLAYLTQWAEDLRETDRVLHHFLEAVEKMEE